MAVVENIASPLVEEVGLEEIKAEDAQHRRFGTYLGRLALASGIIAGGALVGASIPSEVSLGPLNAAASINLDHTINIDAGPLGSIPLKDPSSWPFVGVDLRLKSLQATPDQLQQILQDPTDASSYGAIIKQSRAELNAPHATSTITGAIEDHALKGAGAAIALELLGVGSLLYARRHMSPELKASYANVAHSLTKSRRAMSLGTLGMTVACSMVAASPTEATAPTSPGPSMFAGSVFEHIQGSGTLPTLFNQAAWQISASYDRMTENFNAAFEKMKDTLPQDAHSEWIEDVSDNHCNSDIQELASAIADKFKSRLVFDTGDAVMGLHNITFGDFIEDQCMAVAAHYLEQNNRDVVFITGNHDSSVTVKQAKKYGMIVLKNGEVKKVDGYTIIGWADPRYSAIGHKITYKGNETLEDVGKELESAACQQKPDFLLVHAPEAAIPTVARGCVKASFSGDTHHQDGPNLLFQGPNGQNSYQYTQGTSGGAKPGDATVGFLKAPAKMSEFRVDTQTHQLLGSVTITAYPDEHVSITRYIPVPTTLDTAVVNTYQHSRIVKPN